MEEEYGIKLKIDLSDISKQVKKAKSMAKDIESSFREVKVTGLDGTSKIKIDTSSVEEVKELTKKIEPEARIIYSGAKKTKIDFWLNLCFLLTGALIGVLALVLNVGNLFCIIHREQVPIKRISVGNYC